MVFLDEYLPQSTENISPPSEMDLLRQQLTESKLREAALTTRAETAEARAETTEKENTTLIERAETAEKTADTDLLTDLPNRRSVLSSLNKELGDVERKSVDLVVIEIDIDRFKNINDMYGHAQGDKVLVEFGRKINGGLRREDTFGRFGGEEFLMILPVKIGITDEEVRHLLDALNKRAKDINRSDKEFIPLTISIGAVIVRSGLKSISEEDVLKQIDDNLYQSKKTTRDTYTLNEYNPDRLPTPPIATATLQRSFYSAE